jgi:hypothetical protein
MSDDTIPPHDRETLTELPAANDTDPPPPPSSRPPPVILAGHAQRRMSQALTTLVEAYLEVERISMACAAGLDSLPADTEAP